MEYQSPWPNTPSTPQYQTPYENAYTSIATFEIDVHGSDSYGGLAMYHEDGVSSSDYSEEPNNRVLRSHSRAATSPRLQEVDDGQPSVSSTTSYAAMITCNNAASSIREPVPAYAAMITRNNAASSIREPVPAIQIMAPPAPAHGTLELCLQGSECINDIINKLQPSFVVEVVKAIFTGHFKRIIGSLDCQMLYAIVHPQERKVKSLMSNIFVKRDDRHKCWLVFNGFGVVFRSIGNFEQQLHMQSRFSMPMREIPFTLNFKQGSRPQAHCDRGVPDAIDISFLASHGRCFNWTGSFTLSPPTEVIDSNSQSTFVQQYDRDKSGVVDYCLVIEVDGKLQSFPVTMRDDKSYFSDLVCHWVVCTLSGNIQAKSVDSASNPFDVLWWHVFEGTRVLCSTMDICVSVPGPALAHDIKFTQSENECLNATFHSKGSSVHTDGTLLKTYEMTDARNGVLMQLNFCLKLRKWLIKSIDQAVLPMQWNMVAMSNCSATYTNPTFCKEWYVLGPSGTYKLSPLMTCEMTARRIACPAVN